MPVGITGRYQVNDTHLYKTVRMKLLNQMRRKETSSISTEDYQRRVSKLMSVVILWNKVPEWLWLSVQHISKKIPDEDCKLIKNLNSL